MNIIGKDVKTGEKIVGKVTEYDIETGLCAVEITSKIDLVTLIGDHIGISNRA